MSDQSNAIPITIVNSNDGSLTIQATSSNVTLISNANIVISGSANNTLNTPSLAGIPLNLTLLITPSQGQCGQTTISLTVTDANGLTDTHSFHYEIYPDEYFLTASDGYSSDYYGFNVGISSHHAIIGAYYDDDKGSNSGSAYILTYGASGWSETAKLSATDGAASDYFGYAVDISGDYALVGAYYDDDKGTDAGAAYIFKRQGTHWVQYQKLLANEGAASDYFGNAVSISGDYAIIGAYYDDDIYSNQGMAYIFKRDGSIWTQQAQLSASDKASSDYFGCAVDISGNYAIVGAKYDDDSYSSSGSAYIFVREGDTWTEQAKLTASDPHTNDYFGFSVSISGDYAIVGAYGNDQQDASDMGAAYIFKRTGTSWSQTAKLTPTDGAASDNYAYAVSISEDHVIVGSKNNDNPLSDSGSAYLYQRDGENWHLKLKLAPENAQESDLFGHAVAIFKDNIVIGAYYDDDMGSNSGSASIFMMDTPPQMLEMDNQQLSTQDTHSTTLTIINANGSDITLTAISNNPNFISNNNISIAGSGSNTYVSSTSAGVPVYLTVEMSPQQNDNTSALISFILTDSNGLTQTTSFTLSSSIPEQKLLPDDAAASDNAGNAIDIHEDFAIVGSRYDDDKGSNSGSAYIFQRNASGWYQMAKLTASDGAADDHFGYAVAIHENYAIVGSRYDDDSYTNSGSAYIYKRYGNVWQQETKIKAGDMAASDYFGYAVDISNDFAVVGAYLEDNNYTDQGSVYVFQPDGAAWTQVAKLMADDRAASDYFGYAVSIFDHYILVGARYDDDNGSNSGSAYVLNMMVQAGIRKPNSLPVMPQPVIILDRQSIFLMIMPLLVPISMIQMAQTAVRPIFSNVMASPGIKCQN
ncbi:MAG: PKD domain-containing protein [Candidatus Magnetoglobus multicellularis str. Araruama]|uniref:PKD domain-containing protein n=1 Tax=Candidatus Magnetoglobus multicellularis str. Araruama TaxID=890399 RepID=A0A1V1P3X3_9BACT|nr:MAG: PKD domain-containing protein [Candidatus Magnetoglobus multicellularis str. Araruama]